MTTRLRYTCSLDGITPDKLRGFFAGWPNPPSPETHLRILQRAYRVWLAIDDTTGQVVGFVNAISDGLHAAFLPNLEVLPGYRGQGIGSELLRRMVESLCHLYAIDLVCDPEIQPFYERQGFRATVGMSVRNYDRQMGIGNR